MLNAASGAPLGRMTPKETAIKKTIEGFGIEPTIRERLVAVQWR